MKYKIFKYLFFIIAILLIICAIVFVLKNRKNEVSKLANDTIEKKVIKEIKIGIANFDTINPVLTNNYDIQYLSKLVFDSLIEVSRDYKIENNLAEECSKLNNTTYLVKLKSDKYFHNGDNLDAYDVKFTIENLKLIKSIYSENVKNIEKIEVIDNDTLKIYLNEEVGFFEYLLTFPILNKNCYEENTLQSKTKILIGTGRYKILEYTDKEIILVGEKNKIIIKIYKELKDVYMAILKDEIDLLTTKNIEYEKYIGKLGINNNFSSDREYDYILLNLENTLLKNLEIRKALNYFIDRNQIIYNIFDNKYIEINFPINPESYLYYKYEKNYNINKGKEILLENGWNLKDNIWEKDGKQLKIELMVDCKNKLRCEVAKEIKKQLESNGINIKIIETNSYYYNQKIKYKNFEMALTGNILPISPNVETYLGKENIGNYKNEEIINILEEIKNISNEEILKEKYYKIQEIYVKEMPFISLYINPNYILYNSKIQGNFLHNWYNLYYNIDNWYIIKN